MDTMIAQMKIGNVLIDAGDNSTQTHMKAADRVVAHMVEAETDMDTAIAHVLLVDYKIQVG